VFYAELLQSDYLYAKSNPMPSPACHLAAIKRFLIAILHQLTPNHDLLILDVQIG
jgi:hypothetical protein